ncbi:N-acetylmuramoyl-L-alanine amidase [Palleronia pelagia]|uniref:N-acetylmuramoyl-L-alanine amidase n=1 Tax=Palleronia pelagia TaxID=387096 RepID=A0A1H8HUX3_9RHOB|nr:N-acetylmuramoyl-L-alanine amidase [Palleronia pelagia]SEN59811.1 N-acetylmuramoyl-L-alanine amidase [Palleronia pelagia]
MKIAIVIGHNARAQGAVRITDGRTEYDWNGQLAELIRAHDPEGVRIFRRDPSAGGYSREIDKVYAETDAWGADVTVELHFNGSADPRATGCLTLSSGTPGSMALAREVQARMLAVMGNEDDGVQVRGRHDRGGRSLWQGRAPAILTEPYFGGNAQFCHAADANMDELAEAIYRGCMAIAPAEQCAA